MKRFRLSRRTLLRGATATGVAIGLPRLDAMRDDHGRLWTGEAYAAPSTKLITFFLFNGFPRRDRGLPIYDFVPQVRGRNYAITPCLEPIADLKSDFTIALGFNSQSDNSDSHASGTCAFATGTTSSLVGALGPSIDQIAAQRAGGNGSLVTAVGNPSGDSNGHSSACFTNISWIAKEQPAPSIRNPVALFNKIFGNGAVTGGNQPPPEDPLKKVYRRNILDFVKSDIDRLRPKLGTEDRARLDAHLTSIAKLQSTLDQVAIACDAPTDPTKALTVPNVNPGSSDAEKASYQQRLTDAILGANGFISVGAVQAEIFGLAFRCDAYRFGAFMCANSGTEDAWDITPNTAFPGNKSLWPGHDPTKSPKLLQGERIHSALHAVLTETDSTKLEALHQQWIAFTQSNMYMFRKFLMAMEGGTGDKSIIDNSVIYCGPELAYGPGHSLDDYVYLIAGRAGGMKPGNFIEYNNTPTRDLLFTLLKYAGFNETSFAGTSKTVAGLDT